MSNTIFSKDEIIEGEDLGEPYKFQVLKDGVQGSGSVYGPGMDLIQNKRVFLKKYFDPRPKAPWFSAFVEYQKNIFLIAKSPYALDKFISRRVDTAFALNGLKYNRAGLIGYKSLNAL